LIDKSNLTKEMELVDLTKYSCQVVENVYIGLYSQGEYAGIYGGLRSGYTAKLASMVMRKILTK
jgi:hypothetical protein